MFVHWSSQLYTKWPIYDKLKRFVFVNFGLSNPQDKLVWKLLKKSWMVFDEKINFLPNKSHHQINIENFSNNNYQ